MPWKSTILAACLGPGMLAACGGAFAGEGESAQNGDCVHAVSTAVLPSPHAFDVDITLSEAARKRLEASKESVLVAAMYFAGGKKGIPKDLVNAIGLVDIGRAQIELAGQGRAAFDGSAVQRERLDFIEGDLQVNVNAYSGRRSSPDNLLECGMFQDAVRIAASKPTRLACRLIGE